MVSAFPIQTHYSGEAERDPADTHRPKCIVLGLILRLLVHSNLMGYSPFIYVVRAILKPKMKCNGILHRQTRNPFFLGIRSGMDMSNSPGGTKGEKIVL